MNIKDFLPLISIISEEKGFSFEKTKEIVEAAIAAAYKKEYCNKFHFIRVEIDIENNNINFFKVKSIVNEEMIYTEEEKTEIEEQKIYIKKEEQKIFFNEERHIMLKDAQKIDKTYSAGDEIIKKMETKEKFGRIAAQSAKQIILQKIKEAEKEIVLKEYLDKEGQIISGSVQGYDSGDVVFNLGRTLGVLLKEDQTYNEDYKIGERFNLYIKKIEKEGRGHFIFLSRNSPRLIEELFKLEVPEILSEQIEIKFIAREAGVRTKIAFAKKDENIDPIGSAIGPKGIRVMAIIDELRGERIDVIRHSDDIKEFIENSLSPAKIIKIQIKSDNFAEVFIFSDQIALAIGKEGQNIRLASKLTNHKIDIKKIEEIKEDDIKNTNENLENDENKE